MVTNLVFLSLGGLWLIGVQIIVHGHGIGSFSFEFEFSTFIEIFFIYLEGVVCLGWIQLGFILS